MSPLAPEADRAVREAVDAFLCGAARSSMLGETFFDTKNSRYRLIDGVLFASEDASLIGAELVGWLLEGPEQSVVQDNWIAGARAVMVDRKRNRNIIVTSTSRVFRVDGMSSGANTLPRSPLEMHGSPGLQHGSMASQRGQSPLPPPSMPPPSSTNGPLTPRRPIPPCPPPPIGRVPGTTELSVATAMLTRDPRANGPSAMPPPPVSPTPRPSPLPLPRTSAPPHPPPRLAAQMPRDPSPPGGARLPYPSPPPSARVPAPMRRLELSDAETDDPTVPQDRALLPLPPRIPRPAPSSPANAPPPASGLRRASPAGVRKASRRGIVLG